MCHFTINELSRISPFAQLSTKIDSIDIILVYTNPIDFISCTHSPNNFNGIGFYIDRDQFIALASKYSIIVEVNGIDSLSSINL